MIRDIEGLVKEVAERIKEFTDIAVLGMSGGADSSLVATLCTLALGPENVYSLHMPYNSKDKETFNSRSWSLAERLGIHRRLIEIDRIADAISDGVMDFTGTSLSLINHGNARSRARMCVLYGVSTALHQAHPGKRVRVIGTGNMSEDFIGYDTKGGDALCDLFPIGELFKSEVYQALEHFRDRGIIEEKHIDRVPSAGLWDGQTDEKELGRSYDEMEPVVKRLSTGLGPNYHKDFPDQDLLRFVWDRHIKNKHKHEAPPVLGLRQFCD